MNDKRIFSIITILTVIVIITTVMAVNSIASETQFIEESVIMKLKTNKMLVNGQQKMLDSENPRTMPYLDKNSRTLVPMRCISESLGGQVKWLESEKTVIINIDGKVIKFKINDNNINKDGKDYEMDTSAIIYENRTYIPLRALIEIGLEKYVYWDNDAQIIVISNNKYVENNGISDIAEEKILKELDSLSIVENFDIFKKLVVNQNKSMPINIYDDVQANQSSNEETKNEYSNTNNQVIGVDEADIVKTDGKYVYYIASNKLIIVDVQNPNNISIIKEINYEREQEDFDIQEILLENNKLVVIGNERIYDQQDVNIQEKTKILPDLVYIHKYDIKTKAICYDVSDPNNIKEDRIIKSDGYYVSSRKINDNIYLISNKKIYTYNIDKITEDEIKPEYYDSLISNENIKIGFDCIKYFPEIDDNSYSLITSFNINNEEKVQVETFLGMSEKIYMDDDNLYVASTTYDNDNYKYTQRIADNTIIYKFDILGQSVVFNSKGKVEGQIINQFSMDEYNGYFRIATTNEGIEPTNELHVLNSKMREVSNIINIAENERIYSVRFMENRAYIVTYRQVDPLFVVDLTNPLEPKILGELKIEGYSTYLHPYDQNHIIAFGIDTEEIDDNTVEQKGLKIAMFDVADPTNPKQMYTEKIGDNDTTSQLIYDHKALLFDKDKEILAFPITIYENQKGKSILKDIGAVIYKINLKDGFIKKGIISNEYNLQDNYNLYNAMIERIIYINDNYFTLSPKMIKCSNMDTLKELSKTKI